MKKQKQENGYNLIEHVLTLLSALESKNIDIVHLHESPEQEELLSVTDSPKSQMAYEVIKFMDEMPGGFLIYHADGDEEIIYANKALLRIFQCDTLKEFRAYTKNSFRGIVHPDDLDEVEESILEQIRESHYDLDYVEYRITRKDGEVRWIEDYGHYIYSENLGGIFYVFLGDATEKQNRRLEVIEGLSINYETILYADLETDKIMPYRLSTRTEHQFEKKFQVRKLSWYVADYVKEWVHPEDRAAVSEATNPEYIKKKLAQNETYYINYRVILNGETQYLQLRFVNVSSDENVSQIVMGYRKVDEEIRNEMEQKQILEEALNKAKLAITAKNTFLSNMSHDIRTPLNAISGFASIAKKHVNDGEVVRDYLSKIETAGGQLLNLLDMVLEMSWEETKEDDVSEGECNLCNIVREVYEELSPQAEEKKLSVFLEIDNVEHPDIYSDSEKLKRILMQLAGNAIKYTEKGGKVWIRAVETDKLPNGYAVYQLIVKDNGVGISKDFIKRIFEPFEREENTTLSGVHGTGLGLTIVRNTVEKMSGDIAIDSTKGEGSTFTVTFRFRIQTPSLSLEVNTAEILEQLKGQKILLVEDNEINMEIAAEILQDFGFCIETAIDGSVAVEKMKNAKPGDYILVLMDIQMPVMDGREAARRIRSLENPALAHIPIIALSADAFESDKRKSIESGMDAHLTKPIDISLLVETIAKTIRVHQALYGEEG